MTPAKVRVILLFVWLFQDTLRLAAILVQKIKWCNVDARFRLPALFSLVASSGIS